MATNQPEEQLGYDDFVGLTVRSLKYFLTLRGLKKTGKKVEFVARVFGAYELGIPKKITQEQIFDTIKSEYAKRLDTNGIKSDPHLLGDEFWEDDVVLWPHVDDGKLFRYILHVILLLMLNTLAGTKMRKLTRTG